MQVAKGGIGASVMRRFKHALVPPLTFPVQVTVTNKLTSLTSGRFGILIVILASALGGCSGGDLKSGPGSGQTVQPLQLGVLPASIDFTAAAGGPAPTAQTVSILNAGVGTVTGLGIGTILYEPVIGGWLTASIAGASFAPATLTLSVDVTGVAPGIYFAIVPVTSTVTGVLQRNVVVSLTVTPVPVISVSPDTIFLTGSVGGTNPSAQPVSVTNAGNGSLSGMSVASIIYDSTGGGWLSASLDQPTDPAVLTVQASLGGLAAATYTAVIPVVSSVPGTLEDSVVVRLTVSATTVLPAIGLSPTSINFIADAIGASPPPQTSAVTNTGGGTLTGLTIGTISYSPSGVQWLTATLNQASAPATITLAPSITGLAPGLYRATVRVQASGTSNSPRAIAVAFRVNAAAALQLSSQAEAFAGTIGQPDPLPRNIAVTNAGSGSLSGVATSVTYGAGQPTGWLQVTQAGTSTPTAIALTPHITGLLAGNYTASVSVSSTTPGISPKTVTATLALASQTGFFNIISGDGQTGFVDSVLPAQLVARVTDAAFNPVPNVPVIWTVANGGTLVNTTSVTNNIGEARTNWKLGHFAGIHTVTVSSAGLPSLVFSADAQLLPSGGNSHPNEPSGFIRFAEHNMSSLPSFPRTLGGLMGSWYGHPQGDPDLVVVNPDTSAPESPPNTVRTRFFAGLQGGIAPVNMGGWDAAGTGAGGQKSKLYVSVWVHILGPDYQNHPVGTKMGFIAYGEVVSGAQNQGVFRLKGNGSTAPQHSFKLEVHQQNHVNRVLGQNVNGASLMTTGTWHQWEWLVELNTLGQADGILKWWIDGTLIMDYSDMEYILPGFQTKFHQWRWQPVWGGTGSVRTRDDFIAIDHVYMSGVP
jgi:hypothetical protein